MHSLGTTRTGGWKNVYITILLVTVLPLCPFKKQFEIKYKA